MEKKEKKEGHMLKFFLIFNLPLALSGALFGQDLLNVTKSNNSDSLQSTSSIVLVDQEREIYPGKPLLMSLILPGAGQYYNRSPIWKTASFLGVEIGSIIAWNHFTNEADQRRKDFQDFADIHWSLENWYNNWQLAPPQSDNNELWQNFPALLHLSGTHDLTLIISEGDELIKVSSDSLEKYGYSENIDVVRDRHFYENIGKYDQFVGGWDDAYDSWYAESKDVGDSIEIIIKTPYKQNYIDQRFKCNQMLSAAKYSITVLMFNHVISGIESVWSSQRKASIQKNKQAMISPKFNLVYDPLNPMGIGGMRVSLFF